MVPLQLIVGLGNPGERYARTRHNVGAWFVRQLADDAGADLRPEPKFFGATATITVGDHTLHLLEPSTYMNESGKSVAAIARFYRIPPTAILVAHDELDFSAGHVRVKAAGGHGGHNGLRDIIRALGSADFYRLRLGIGHPGHRDRVTPYVLSAPSAADRENIDAAIWQACRQLPIMVAGDWQRVMRELH